MKNPPLNVCIYCGAKPGDTVLVKKDKPATRRPLELSDFGREHILPEGLKGNTVLGKASCSNCEAITGNIERVVIREMLWPLRSTIGHKSGLRLPDTTMMGVIPSFPPAGITRGFPEPNYGSFTITALSADEDDLREVKRNRHEVRPTEFKIANDIYGRFLAKVAHGASVMRWGLDGFIPFLPRVVLGDRIDWWSFVGGATSPMESNEIHVLETSPASLRAFDEVSPKDESFIHVRIRLFGNVKPFPTYSVIAGVLPHCDPRLLLELKSRGFILST